MDKIDAQGHVQITPREIYDRVCSLGDKIDVLIATDMTDDHERRLRRLEAWAYALPPAIIIAGVALVIQLLGL